MTSELIWQEEYNIGVDIIDKEHQRLFKIINKLFRLPLRMRKKMAGGPAGKESNSSKPMQ